MKTLAELIRTPLSAMILSASGWRKIFAESGNEQDSNPAVSSADRLIAAAAADVFCDFLAQHYFSETVHSAELSQKTLRIVLGFDTRPTGKLLADSMICVLKTRGADVHFVGVSAAPEIMAYARNYDGFIYISASHNPIGHNGLKFGLNDGGVIDGQKSAKLIKMFRERCACESSLSVLYNAACDETSALDCSASRAVSDNKKEALESYTSFLREVITGSTDTSQQNKVFDAVKSGISKSSVSVAVDMNGSARTVSIDKDIITSVGAGFYAVNNTPGAIAHEIIPEPENLVYCAQEMKRLHDEGFSDVSLGYMPDCDGDRGNIVYWDYEKNEPKVLGAQEVFALAVLSELAYLRWLNPSAEKLAVAVNDPTSMRINAVAQAFNASVFRAEVGEANVVNLARSLRSEGWTVRILGEGSNGGNITHPSAVRDPLSTVFALLKLLTLRSCTDEHGTYMPGLFEIWCILSNNIKMYRPNFTLCDVLASLPSFTTTGVSEKRAVVDIKTADHSLLKREYQKQLEKDFTENISFYRSLGLYSWKSFSNNGITETADLTDFGLSGRGGLKILFFNSENKPSAFVWMRGSGTEPVFRVMCDFSGIAVKAEKMLLERHTQLVLAADSAASCV